jgi:hypothetical protein
MAACRSSRNTLVRLRSDFARLIKMLKLGGFSGARPVVHGTDLIAPLYRPDAKRNLKQTSLPAGAIGRSPPCFRFRSSAVLAKAWLVAERDDCTPESSACWTCPPPARGRRETLSSDRLRPAWPYRQRRETGVAVVGSGKARRASCATDKQAVGHASRHVVLEYAFQVGPSSRL